MTYPRYAADRARMILTDTPGLGLIGPRQSGKTTLVDLVLGGGFPEALARTAPNRQRAWFRSYVEVLAQRDIPDLAALDKIGVMPSLIEQAALYSGQIVNNSAM